MKYHVVQVNERIHDIARKYNVTIDEIKKLNRHISNIEYIIPGMKLRLPVLSEPVSEELKENFLDIEKYYPKMEDFKEVEIEKKTDNIDNDDNNNDIDNNYNNYNNNYNNNYYNTPYQQYYPYNNYPNVIPQGYQSNPIYYYENFPYRNPSIQPLDKTTRSSDFTLPQYQISNAKENESFDKPAFCDPILIEGLGKKYEKYTYNKTPMKDFQEPMYTPPYPINKNIEDCKEVIDENIKEIKMDLRDFVKKNTTIKKKQ